MYLDLRLVNLVVINMEKNTICLDVETYNILRDFKNKIEENYSVKMQDFRGYPSSITFVSKDLHVKELLEEVNNLKSIAGKLDTEKTELNRIISKLQVERDELTSKKRLISKKELTLADIKKIVS